MKVIIGIKDIPNIGCEYTYTEQSIWETSIQEFDIPCNIIKPLEAKVFVQKHENGCLIKGNIIGKVALPCDRCANEAVYELHHEFEEYEELPDNNYENDIRVDDNAFVMQPESRIYKDKKELYYIDMGALLWEEFLLALPIKPLCKSDCKGSCLVCGVNLNTSSCACREKKTDPRLEKLKNFKIITK